MVTAPLELKKHLAEPRKGINPVPFIDILVIGLFALMSDSQFIFSQGVKFDFALPELESRLVVGRPADAVLTVSAGDMLFFEGGLYSIDSLPTVFSDYVADNAALDAVLLVRIRKEADVQTLLTICDIARESGFSAVQVAADDPAARNGDFLPRPRR